MRISSTGMPNSVCWTMGASGIISCSISARKAGFDGAEADEINLVWPLDRVAIRAAAGCFAAGLGTLELLFRVAGIALLV